MKIAAFLLLTVGWAGTLLGQETAPSLPPLPEGPLLKRAPDFSAWTVLSRKPSGQSELDPLKPGQAKARPQGQAAVTKTGRIIHELSVDAQGKRTDVWHVGNVQVSVPPGGGSPSVFPDFGGDDIYTTNYAVSDFAGLEWVSAATYNGIQKVMGKDCIIFRTELNVMRKDERMEMELQASRAILRMQAESRTKGGSAKTQLGLQAPTDSVTKAPAVACIDLETRLPVAVTFGKETRTYQFEQPPGEMQVLPTSLAAAVNEYQTRIQGLARLPARP